MIIQEIGEWQQKENAGILQSKKNSHWFSLSSYLHSAYQVSNQLQDTCAETWTRQKWHLYSQSSLLSVAHKVDQALQMNEWVSEQEEHIIGRNPFWVFIGAL